MGSIGKSEKDIVAHGLAEKPWDLWRVGTAWWNKESLGIGDPYAIPENIAAVGLMNAEKGANQGRFARTDLSGDNGQ